MTDPVDIEHFTDPGCPWAYCAGPALVALRWRYGDQLRWRHRMIVLADTAQTYLDRGYRTERLAANYAGYRVRYGMPFTSQPRARVIGTGLACRAVIAAGQQDPGRVWPALRALQRGWFATTLLLDEPGDIIAALEGVVDLDATSLHSDAVDRAYAADKAASRLAADGPADLLDRTANTDGATRFTAPTLIVSRGASRVEVGGFQPLEAYEMAIANVAPDLVRRPPGEDDVVSVLNAFPEGLTTRELAQCLAPDLEPPDDLATELALIDALAAGTVVRTPLDGGALWFPATPVGQRFSGSTAAAVTA